MNTSDRFTISGSLSRISGLRAAFGVRALVLCVLLFTLIVAFNVSIGAVGQGLALSLVAVCTYVSFRVIEFPNLTVDGAYPIGGAVAAALIVSGTQAEVSLVAAFVAGALAGLCTALITMTFKIDGLLSSIIVLTGAYTITLRIMGSSNIPLLNVRTLFTPYTDGVRSFLITTFGAGARRLTNNVVEILVFTVLMTIILLALSWFFRTEFGLTMRAAGKNRQMVRAVGVDDRLLIVVGLMLANGLAGLAGALVVQQQGFADVQMGVGIIVRGLAAMMIGEVLLRPQSPGQSVLAVTLGMVVFEVLRAWVFAALNLAATDIRLVSALVVLVALAAPELAARWRAWRRSRAARSEGTAVIDAAT